MGQLLRCQVATYAIISITQLIDTLNLIGLFIELMTDKASNC